MVNRTQLLEEIMSNAETMRKRMWHREGKGKSRMTPQQWALVRIVAHTPACTVKDIAEKMHMSSSAVTQLVDKLMENGFVIRTESKADRRAVSLSLSPKAAAEVKHLKSKMLERMRTLFNALSDRELETFVAMHRKIVDHVGK